jgi:hypothetical protein
MSKETRGFIRHFVHPTLYRAGSPQLSPSVLLYTEVAMAKANMFHCLELERTELAFFILAKRAEY